MSLPLLGFLSAIKLRDFFFAKALKYFNFCFGKKKMMSDLNKSCQKVSNLI